MKLQLVTHVIVSVESSEWMNISVRNNLKLLLIECKNKTPGYHQHLFHPPILLKIPFRNLGRWERFFSFFKIWKFSDFSGKKSQLRWKRVLGNNIIWYAFYSKFANFNDFGKNQVCFPKIHLFFFRKNPNFVRFEKLHSFGRILRQIHYNLVMIVFEIQNLGISCNHTKKQCFEWMICLPYYIWSENNEWKLLNSLIWKQPTDSCVI